MLVYTWQKFERWLFMLFSLIILKDLILNNSTAIGPALLNTVLYFLELVCLQLASLVFLTSFRESFTAWSLAIFALAFTQRCVSDEKVARCPLVETRASSHKTAPIADSKTQSLC